MVTGTASKRDWGLRPCSTEIFARRVKFVRVERFMNVFCFPLIFSPVPVMPCHFRLLMCAFETQEPHDEASLNATAFLYNVVCKSSILIFIHRPFEALSSLTASQISAPLGWGTMTRASS